MRMLFSEATCQRPMPSRCQARSCCRAVKSLPTAGWAWESTSPDSTNVPGSGSASATGMSLSRPCASTHHVRSPPNGSSSPSNRHAVTAHQRSRQPQVVPCDWRATRQSLIQQERTPTCQRLRWSQHQFRRRELRPVCNAANRDASDLGGLVDTGNAHSVPAFGVWSTGLPLVDRPTMARTRAAWTSRETTEHRHT